MDETELRQAFLLRYYEDTRAEIVQRIASRDVALTLFLGAAAVLIGLSGTTQAWVLYVLPVLGFGATALRANHTRNIFNATRFLCTQYREEVDRLFSGSPGPTHWDLWNVPKLGTGFGRGDLANATLILAPQLLAVAIATATVNSPWARFFGLTVGIIFVISSVLMQISSIRDRRDTVLSLQAAQLPPLLGGQS